MLVSGDAFLGWAKWIEEITGQSFDTDLLFWGDSLTAGAGGGNTSYPKVCAETLGLTRINAGVGGETANTISARQGGNNVIIPAGAVNGTYATLSDIFGASIAPLLQGNGSDSGNALIIDGQTCTLTHGSSGYTISGYTGDEITVPKIARFRGSDFTGKVVVIFVGQNGATFTGLTGVDARIAIIDSMIKHIGHDRYVIMGLSTGTNTSREADDNQMLAHYGNKFFPTRKLLVNYGLTINGLTPTTQDETDIANGTVPTQLRSDGTHMNAYGYTAIGKLLADKIRSLGYVD
jgi:lysophospholipase L1-like esterase